MKTSLIAAFALSAATLGSANADDMAGMGPGALTCSKYLAFWVIAKSAPSLDEGFTSTMFFAWAEGFMTGLNVSRTDGKFAILTAKGSEYEQNILWNYCEDHPDAYFVEAVKFLYASLPVK